MWSAEDGTIDATGKFTAPATQRSVQVIATSVEDPTKKGNAVVFVTPAPTWISVSPTKATVQTNVGQQFTATGAPGGTIPVVNWSVSGTGCTGGGCGTIDSTGRYTAPASVPTPPEVMITATSATDSSISGSATAILGGTSANGKLKGQYAFLIQGYDGDGIEAMAGTFVADGNGNLTAGVEDLDFTSSLYVAPNVPFTGTYAIGSDNRGSMTLTRQNALSQTFSFSLGSFTAGIADRGRLVEVDGTDFYGTGVLIKQDPSAFTTAAISGGYAFGFSGTRFGGSKLIAAGRFTANGGSVSDGQVDVYNSQSFISGAGAPRVGVNEPLTGSYQVGANGRGTATFTGSSPEFTNFSFYVVSPTELLFIEIDSCQSVFQPCSLKGGLSGIALQQAGGPFSTSSLYGGAVLNLTGSTDVSAGQVAYDRSVSVGQATFDGGGSLVGTIDTNNGGVFSPNNNVVGVYTVDTNGMGRGVMNLLGGHQTMPFYIVSSGKAFIIDTSGTAEFGMFESQTGGPFSNASISGSYVLGTSPLLLNWWFSPVVGMVTGNGNGGLNGVTDSKDGNASGLGSSFSATYSFGANGRADVAITPSAGPPVNMVFYFISPTKAVGIRTDAGAANTGLSVIEE